MTKKIAYSAVLFVMAISSAVAEPIVTDSTSRSYTDSTSNSTTTMPVYEAGDPTHRNSRND